MSLVGTKLADYRVLKLIECGGQARVYKAFQRSQRRVVALKVHENLSGFDRTSHAHFQNEVKHATILRHPHIVKTFDSGVHDGLFYMAMELLQGETLERHLMVGRRMAAPDVLLILAQLARALSYMHGNHIIHGDIKPGNIFLATNSPTTLKLIDFGSSTRIGEIGEGFGTQYYASPEQLRNEALDQRTDIYSLGVTLHEMLSGQRPTDVLWSSSSLNNAPINAPTRLSGLYPNVSAGLDDVVRRCLCKDVNQRFNSVWALFRAFARAAYSESASISCPSCVHSNLPGSAFCDSCGYFLGTCHHCGRVMPPGAAFCDNCGAHLAASPPHNPVLYPPPSPTRR